VGDNPQVVPRLWLLVSVVFTAPLLWTQTASLRGHVSDDSGAVIPGAVITLKGPDGRAQRAKTDGSGFYSAKDILLGPYAVEASAPHLTLAQPIKIVIKPGVQTLDLKLSVASMQEKISVQENAGLTLSTDAGNNASAVVLRGEDLGALPDDPNDL
jgi:hypothetical protein